MHRALLGLVLLTTLSACQQLPHSTDAPGGPAPDTASSSELSTRPPEHTRPVVRAESVEAVAASLVLDYFEASDEIAHQGGDSAEPLRTLVTDSWYPREEEGVRHLRAKNIRSLGNTRVDQLAIQSARRTLEGGMEVAVFACVDSTAVWVVDAASPEPPEDLLLWLNEGADVEQATEEMLETWQPYLDEVAPIAGVVEPVVIWLVGEQLSTLEVDGTENWRGHHPCGELQ